MALSFQAQQSASITPLKTLFKLLHDLQETITIRTFLVRHYRSGKVFCATCSPTNFAPGTCGPTCSMLSPHKYAPEKLDPTWLTRILRDESIYRSVLTEMKEHGRVASKEQIRKWTSKIDKVRRYAMSDLERRWEMDWYGDQGHCDESQGMNLDWVFEKAWRNKVVEEVEAAFETMMSPMEEVNGVVNVVDTKKRKRRVKKVQEGDTSRIIRSWAKRQKLEPKVGITKRAKRN